MSIPVRCCGGGARPVVHSAKTCVTMKLLLLTAVLLLVQNQVLAVSEDDYATIMVKALKLAASNMNISEDQVLPEWELQAKPVGTDFDCLEYDAPPANSVHELSPYHVSVTGALGDSVTAAMGAGAGNIIEDLIEYRGLSWSIGGDKSLSEVTTLPNIIKKYNPHVKGFSIKTSLLGFESSNSKLNVAVSGAKAVGMEGQAVRLVDKMKGDKNVDYENEWKVVTLWIGGNDLCAYCNDKDKYSPAAYIENIQKALDYLHAEMPRTLVNLVQILDVGLLANIKGLTCDVVHWFACKCATKAADEVRWAAAAYQNEIANLVQSGRYDTRDDFTVVVQPFMIGIDIPTLPDGSPDKSYLAPDCFHFSAKGHREGAIGLWNNMLEPVGGKNADWKFGSKLKCPTQEHPYFYTSKNSPSHSSVVLSSSSDGVSASNGGESEDEANGAGMVTAIVLGVVGFAVLAVVAVIVLNYRRQKSRQTTDEKVPLIRIIT